MSAHQVTNQLAVPLSTSKSDLFKLALRLGIYGFSGMRRIRAGPFNSTRPWRSRFVVRPSNWTCGVFIKWKRISSSIETRLSWPAARNNMRAAILRVLKGHERRNTENVIKRPKLVDLAEFWTCQGRPLCTFERQDSLITSHFTIQYVVELDWL